MSARPVEQRVSGSQHGFIRRIVSPGDLGERLKPFVFLDYIHGAMPAGTGFGFHPHSGIATLTYQLDADLAYEDTTGQKGQVQATGLEWMRAGGGTWHQGFVHPRGPTATGFQLWLALPPGVEDGPPEGRYVPPEDVPQVGNVRVLLGAYGGAVNPIPAPSPVSYLDVVLSAGERWAYDPPASHAVAWVFLYRGRARIGGTLVGGTEGGADGADGAELVVLGRAGTVEIEAEADTRVIVGTAEPHAHPLVLGSHSVHTSRDALARGVARIREIGAQLQREGRR